MNFVAPQPDEIRAALPVVDSVTQSLHQGGFKAVYRATIHGKIEALKLINIPKVKQDVEGEALRKEMIGRVRRELDALGKCESKEIVKLASLTATDISIGGETFIAYSEEWIEGSNLWDILNAKGAKPSESELRVLFVSLLTAIREMWSFGYVHRDIKPLNVMKTSVPDRPFVLLDLGIAFSIREPALTFNPAQRMFVSHRYFAPEMINPDFRETIDYRCDLYTTALSVFEYAAQEHPLARDEEDELRTAYRAVRQMPRPLKQFRSDLSDFLCQTVDQMLKKKPALRPANLNMLISQLQNLP
jgi:serine/threonine protein kinase